MERGDGHFNRAALANPKGDFFFPFPSRGESPSRAFFEDVASWPLPLLQLSFLSASPLVKEPVCCQHEAHGRGWRGSAQLHPAGRHSPRPAAALPSALQRRAQPRAWVLRGMPTARPQLLCQPSAGPWGAAAVQTCPVSNCRRSLAGSPRPVPPARCVRAVSAR